MEVQVFRRSGGQVFFEQTIVCLHYPSMRVHQRRREQDMRAWLEEPELDPVPHFATSSKGEIKHDDLKRILEYFKVEDLDEKHESLVILLDRSAVAEKKRFWNGKKISEYFDHRQPRKSWKFRQPGDPRQRNQHRGYGRYQKTLDESVFWRDQYFDRDEEILDLLEEHQREVARADELDFFELVYN